MGLGCTGRTDELKGTTPMAQDGKPAVLKPCHRNRTGMGHGWGWPGFKLTLRTIEGCGLLPTSLGYYMTDATN